MTPLLIGLVLTAAVLHAAWNAMAKSGGTPELSIASYQLVGSLVCIVLAVWLPFPDREVWPMIIGSVVIHNIYYFALARAYRSGDLSQVYPLFRGVAPVLVACGAAVVAHEYLTLGTIAGIVCISLGVVSLAFRTATFGAMPRAAVAWGSATAVLIAAYTVVDGLGIRTSSNKLSYIVWLFILEVVPIGIIMLATRRTQWFDYMRGNRWTVIGCGVASATAYGLVIYAMSLGAMAVVSSLRETSVIFATIIGALFLREPFGTARIQAAALVAVGIILMRWLGT
jgi:drug/metabolite transporter (DMT)-like permease